MDAHGPGVPRLHCPCVYPRHRLRHGFFVLYVCWARGCRYQREVAVPAGFDVSSHLNAACHDGSFPLWISGSWGHCTCFVEWPPRPSTSPIVHRSWCFALLHCAAAERGHISIVDLLLQHGADVNAVVDQGPDVPPHDACAWPHPHPHTPTPPHTPPPTPPPTPPLPPTPTPPPMAFRIIDRALGAWGGEIGLGEWEKHPRRWWGQ